MISYYDIKFRYHILISNIDIIYWYHISIPNFDIVFRFHIFYYIFIYVSFICSLYFQNIFNIFSMWKSNIFSMFSWCFGGSTNLIFQHFSRMTADQIPLLMGHEWTPWWGLETDLKIIKNHVFQKLFFKAPGPLGTLAGVWGRLAPS